MIHVINKDGDILLVKDFATLVLTVSEAEEMASKILAAILPAKGEDSAKPAYEQDLAWRDEPITKGPGSQLSKLEEWRKVKDFSSLNQEQVKKFMEMDLSTLTRGVASDLMQKIYPLPRKNGAPSPIPQL